ncbi:MAG: hypothetical protein ACFCGT_23800 [Sandaracinaceae bacterium]
MPSPEDQRSEQERADALLDALTDPDEGIRRAALDEAHDLLASAVAGFLRGHRNLLGRTTLGVEDVHQEVALRLLRRPPTNPYGRPAHVVLRAWVRLVARRVVLDRLRRREDLDTEDDESRPLRVEAAGQDRALHLRRAVQQLRRCADALRSERDRRAFALLREDPDLDALRLAAALDMAVADEAGVEVRAADLVERRDAVLAAEQAIEPELEELLRRASQNAWQLKSRLLKRLARCMREHGFDGLLGAGGGSR